MAQKARTPNVGAAAAARFPVEAYDYNDDVSADIVKTIREERGVDVSKDEWVVVDGFGQLIHA